MMLVEVVLLMRIKDTTQLVHIANQMCQVVQLKNKGKKSHTSISDPPSTMRPFIVTSLGCDWSV